MRLEGNRKLLAGSLSIILVFISALVNPELFTSGETSLGWTMIGIMGIIAGANVGEWFAKTRSNGVS